MKGPVIERLARRHLLPVLPGFVGRRSLVYRRPIEYFLCGLSFDTSAFASSRIYVQAFVQPLFVREGHLWYTFGERLGDNEFWDVDEDEPDPTFAAIAEVARRDALPLFEQLGSLDRFCEQVPEWAEAEPKKLLSLQSLDDPVVSEAVGYAEILRGRKEAGLELLERALASEREEGEYATEERMANLERVLDAVTTFGLEAGQALLEEWRVATIRSLGIEE